MNGIYSLIDLRNRLEMPSYDGKEAIGIYDGKEVIGIRSNKLTVEAILVAHKIIPENIVSCCNEIRVWWEVKNSFTLDTKEVKQGYQGHGLIDTFADWLMVSAFLAERKVVLQDVRSVHVEDALSELLSSGVIQGEERKLWK